jgi:uncharacterized protein YndB with AHSA1/START domain
MDKGIDARSIEKEIRILAPVDAVWKALTDAEELTRWFSLEAKVVPGEGGSIWMAWKEDWQHHTPIAAWEPNKHLRLIYVEPTPPTTPGEPVPPFKIPYQVAVDYYLESRGGETVLRLVHSGFSSDASWDSQYDGTVSGWDFQLAGLKLYLERHYGSPRRCIYCHVAIPRVSIEQAWARLLSPAGLLQVEHPAPSQADSRYAFTTAAGDRLEGVVHVWKPPGGFSATVTNLNDAWMRLHIEELTLFNRRDVNFFIGTYALPEERVARLQANFDGLLKSLFADHR